MQTTDLNKLQYTTMVSLELLCSCMYSPHKYAVFKKIVLVIVVVNSKYTYGEIMNEKIQLGLDILSFEM